MSIGSIWNDPEREQKRAIIRSLWRELGEALDQLDAGVKQTSHPTCVACDRPALGFAGDEPVCGRHVAVSPYRDRKDIRRIPEWRA